MAGEKKETWEKDLAFLDPDKVIEETPTFTPGIAAPAPFLCAL